jgi:prepilin peptidase CpaA
MTVDTHQWLLLAAVAACAVAAAIDLRTGHIPDWITVGLGGGATVARAALTFAHHGHSVSAAAIAAGCAIASGLASALVPLALAHRGGLGGGDVKLFGAVGAACGVFAAFYAQTYAYVFAMVYAIVLVARRGRMAETFGNIRRVVVGGAVGAADPEKRHEGFTEVKFGPAIFAGMCVAAWAQWRMW